MGRETFLAKVVWENGWPVIGPGAGRLEDTLEIPLPEYRFGKEVSLQDHFTFHEDTLDDRFLGITKRNGSMYSLKERKGFLRLYTGKDEIGRLGNPSYLGVRQKTHSFTAGCGVEFHPQNEKETAGIVLFQNHENHLRIEIVRCGQERRIRVSTHVRGEDSVISETPFASDLVTIRLQAKDQKARVWVSESGALVPVAEEIDLLPYTTEEAGGFVGCTIGMYAAANGGDNENYADFAWFSCSND
jgi:alpha-N-arabinofuranosidase